MAEMNKNMVNVKGQLTQLSRFYSELIEAFDEVASNVDMTNNQYSIDSNCGQQKNEDNKHFFYERGQSQARFNDVER